MPRPTTSRSRTKTEPLGALRVIRSGPLHPTLNMGLDEALLLDVEDHASLRLYRWQPAGLSLGYFQASESFAGLAAPTAGADDHAGGPVLVRRLTGGGAIYHGDELTFALTLDAALLPLPVAASYDLVHAAVGAALRSVGVDTARSGAGAAAARPAHPWCFASPVAEDLLSAAGRKLVGSAQRRIRRPTARILHHGSIPLRAPAATPFCGSLAEYGDPDRLAADLEDALPRHLAATLQLTPIAGAPTPRQLARATALAAERYGDPAFTHRR